MLETVYGLTTDALAVGTSVLTCGCQALQEDCDIRTVETDGLHCLVPRIHGSSRQLGLTNGWPSHTTTH